FYLLPFAIGAALAALLSLLGVGLLLSAVAFFVVSLLVIAALRPVAHRHRRLPPPIRTGAAALVGRRAMVLERLVNDEGVGCVRIDGGEVWTARSFDDAGLRHVGDRAEAVDLRGATELGRH